MTMSACFATYDMPSSHHSLSLHDENNTQAHHHNLHQSSKLSATVAVLAAAVAGSSSSSSSAAAAVAAAAAAVATPSISSHKDYTVPLHVDCSVEYELPNQPKPPAGQRVEPLLMIHPCYFRKMESQRRSPFVNNMPNSSRSSSMLSSTSASSRRSARQSQALLQQPKIQQHHQRQQQHQNYQLLHSSSASSNKKTVNQQHQQMRLEQNHQHQQQLQQQQMSQMSQQAHYPVVSSIQQHQPSSSSAKYIENARRAAAVTAAAAIHHNQSRNSISNSLTQQQQRQNQSHQNLIVQNSSSSLAAVQWDQSLSTASATTTLTPHSSNQLGLLPSNASYSSKSLTVGKRDAMISGGYSSKKTGQPDSHHNSLHQTNANNNYISKPLMDASQLRWETASLMIDRSPMATVPSNYQAGPDATPTNVISNNSYHYDTASDKAHGKYRQNVRSHHRLHPYLTSAATPSSIGSVFPQLSAATAAASAIAAIPSFHHLQQVSCYDL